MGKTYIDTVKYLVFANLQIGGLVEKPDVVGAIFGQTEGLLGDELDLRDLQKNGRIGRIEVDLSGRDGKTVGTIKIPSSLDMVETCIIGAALETVDRVGPYEAKINIQKVEDTRNVKRKILIDRAKLLLKSLISTELPESKEISELVRNEVKVAEITTYGPDKLPAGPAVERMDEVVLVEGRADVLNLLKNDITNVVAIQGARVPPSIIILSKQKEVTVFLDGDRGGDIILNELVQGGVEIEYVARAPAGKEVEELTRKELIKCLRSRVPFEQNGNSREKKPFIGNKRMRIEVSEAEPVFKQDEQEPETDGERQFVPAPKFQRRVEERPRVAETPRVVETTASQLPAPIKTDPESLMAELEQLHNTLRARFYNDQFECVKEVPVRDVIRGLEENANTRLIVFDGIITQRLVDLASNKGAKMIVGVKMGNVNKKPEGIEILTKNK